MAMVPANSPDYQPWGPSPSSSPSPSPSPSSSTSTSTSSSFTTTITPPPLHQSPSKLPVDFSPPLIAMVVVVATAFLIITYSRFISRHLLKPFLQRLRRYRHRRRRRRSFVPSSAGDIESPTYSSAFEQSDGFRVFSPYGLDEAVIKTIPLSVYTTKKPINKNGLIGESRDCAVCLLEFEENDYVRTLPVCSHAFHVDCIDIWLRTHANCPLCRAGVFRPESPFIPLMAARIRPSLDDGILESILLEPLREAAPEFDTTVTEIVPEEPSPRRINQSEDRFNGRDFLLKRSYSFGFERNFPSERMVMEPATASPWRYRRGSFWSKRPSPFGSLTKSRVFSFRSYRGMKSPFFRRRGFYPLSESSVRFSGGGSSRRTKSLTSPMFMRSSMSAAASTASAAAAFSSSRLRCGDPEALLSPERFNRR